jgi:glycosyltransferase involved in cell wall biosynthesis
MSRKRNILILIDSFGRGGGETQTVHLTRMLAEDGEYGVHLACLSRRGVLYEEALSLGLGEIPEYPLGSFYDRNAVVQLKRFASYLREHRIDVVHAQDFYTNVFGMPGAALARVPVRIASRIETGDWRTPAQELIERGAFRLSHAVNANAEAVKRHLVKKGVPAEKIAVIYYGFDISRVTPPEGVGRDEMLEALGLESAGPHRRFVTIVANLRTDVKDHPMFLRAARRVHSEIPDAAFIIAGEGELMDEMRALAAELGLARDVLFLGRCERMAELLAISDVCVLSSKSEGFSNSILEYMAAARPVVVTDVGGAREAVVEGESGYIVNSGDDAAMAERIGSLLGEPERARAMGQSGRRVVEEKFSEQAQLDDTKALYEQLLRRSGGKREVLSDLSHESA